MTATSVIAARIFTQTGACVHTSRVACHQVKWNTDQYPSGSSSSQADTSCVGFVWSSRGPLWSCCPGQCPLTAGPELAWPTGRGAAPPGTPGVPQVTRAEGGPGRGSRPSGRDGRRHWPGAAGRARPRPAPPPPSLPSDKRGGGAGQRLAARRDRGARAVWPEGRKGEPRRGRKERWGWPRKGSGGGKVGVLLMEWLGVEKGRRSHRCPQCWGSVRASPGCPPSPAGAPQRLAAVGWQGPLTWGRLSAHRCLGGPAPAAEAAGKQRFASAFPQDRARERRARGAERPDIPAAAAASVRVRAARTALHRAPESAGMGGLSVLK